MKNTYWLLVILILSVEAVQFDAYGDDDHPDMSDWKDPKFRDEDLSGLATIK